MEPKWEDFVETHTRFYNSTMKSNLQSSNFEPRSFNLIQSILMKTSQFLSPTNNLTTEEPPVFKLVV